MCLVFEIGFRLSNLRFGVLSVECWGGGVQFSVLRLGTLECWGCSFL